MKLNTDIIVPAERKAAPVARPDSTGKSIVQVAIEQGANVEQLERMWALQMQYEANEARKQFVAAMAQFKAEPPKLMKNKKVSYANRGGDVTEYMHATLGSITDAIGAALSVVGISYRWETLQEGAQITVSCILTHAAGHAEKTTLAAAPDSSGGKNSIQAVGSTVTYLQRYTLLAATGMATEDQDTDGVPPPTQDDFVSQDQAANLQALIDEVKADKDKFLTHMKVSAISEIPATHYDKAVHALEQKRKLTQKAPKQ